MSYTIEMLFEDAENLNITILRAGYETMVSMYGEDRAQEFVERIERENKPITDISVEQAFVICKEFGFIGENWRIQIEHRQKP